MSLRSLNAIKALEGLQKREFSAEELMKSYLERLEATRNLNIFITELSDIALSKAKEADAKYQKGAAGPLEGLPLVVKDNFCTFDVQTTAGSKILTGFYPQYESTITENLISQGAISIGKSNMDDFAMGSSTITSHFGPSINPWRKKSEPNADLTPGGSSGGTSAAIAAGVGLLGLGSDTGGSIRQPAAFTGTVGLKPTYGLCSRWGIVAFASSLDQAGPMTRTVKDAALMLTYMAGHDTKDSTSLDVRIPNYLGGITGDVKGLRIGIPTAYRNERLSPEITALWDQAIKWFEEAGAEVIDVDLPHTKYSLPTYYIIAPAEAASNLARYDGVRFGLRKSGETLEDLYKNTRTEGFGDEVKRRIMIGTHVLSSDSYDEYYLRAQKVRRKVAKDYDHVFAKVDLMLTPTTASPAFKLGDNMADPVAMYLQDLFTVSANLAGVPGISVPAALSSEGLPLGMQLIGPALSEERLLNAAYFIEKRANFPLTKMCEVD